MYDFSARFTGFLTEKDEVKQMIADDHDLPEVARAALSKAVDDVVGEGGEGHAFQVTCQGYWARDEKNDSFGRAMIAIDSHLLVPG